MHILGFKELTDVKANGGAKLCIANVMFADDDGEIGHFNATVTATGDGEATMVLDGETVTIEAMYGYPVDVNGNALMLTADGVEPMSAGEHRRENRERQKAMRKYKHKHSFVKHIGFHWEKNRNSLTKKKHPWLAVMLVTHNGKPMIVHVGYSAQNKSKGCFVSDGKGEHKTEPRRLKTMAPDAMHQAFAKLGGVGGKNKGKKSEPDHPEIGGNQAQQKPRGNMGSKPAQAPTRRPNRPQPLAARAERL